MKLSYKIWYLDKFLDALEEQASLNTEVLFSGNEMCEEEGPSAEEEIKRAKQRVYVPAQKRKRPSSKFSLIVGYGEKNMRS